MFIQFTSSYKTYKTQNTSFTSMGANCFNPVHQQLKQI